MKRLVQEVGLPLGSPTSPHWTLKMSILIKPLLLHVPDDFFSQEFRLLLIYFPASLPQRRAVRASLRVFQVGIIPPERIEILRQLMYEIVIPILHMAPEAERRTSKAHLLCIMHSFRL